jgi:hypothetical protein
VIWRGFVLALVQRERVWRFLIEDLGIHEAIVQRLPADTPTPPPPWSRTAQSTQR